MNNILVSSDFSNNAYNALFHTTQLMKGISCTFYLLNVYDKNTPLVCKSSNKDLLQQLHNESVEGLQRVCHRIKLDESRHEHVFKIIPEKGNLVETISKIVEEKQIDLVAMGNSGCSELKAVFLGSNVLDTIDSIKACPILTVPKEVDFKPPTEIAFVTDYSRIYDAGLLRPLLFTAKRYGSKIFIMHINEEEALSKQQEMNRSILLEYLSEFDYTLQWMPRFKSKANTIHAFLDELGIDMLAMVNYEHSFLERFTREPVIKRVAFDLDIPFLIIPSTD